MSPHITYAIILDHASVTIKIEDALESCSLSRFADNFHIVFNEAATRPDNGIKIDFDIPPPAKFIINEEAMGTAIYRTDWRVTNYIIRKVSRII